MDTETHKQQPMKPSKMATIETKEDITIELSSRPAYRLWSGREKTDKKFGIIGLPGFCKIMRGIEISVKNDDPYADYHYLQIERAMDDLAFDLDGELDDIETYIKENTPKAMTLPESGSKSPVVLPIRFAARLGFQLVFQILKVDDIVLKVLTANHVGILPNKEKFETIARVEKRVRGAMNLVFKYVHTGVTRDDMAANNKVAQLAKEKMGQLEAGFLEGTERSDDAPNLPLKRLKSIGRIPQGRGEESKKVKKSGHESEQSLDKEIDGILKEEAATVEA